MSGGMRVGLMGATGLVGTEMLRLLIERDFPVAELRPYASARSEGRRLPFGDGEVVCQVLKDGCFDGLGASRAAQRPGEESAGRTGRRHRLRWPPAPGLRRSGPRARPADRNQR